MRHDYAAITPIMVDPTDHKLIQTMQDWDL